MDQEALRQLVSAGELDTIVVAAVDYQGRLFGKRLRADYMLQCQADGTFASMAALANDMHLEIIDGLAFGLDAGFRDVLLRPDYETARLLPWHERTALVLADILDHNKNEVSSAPRTVLKTQIERARALGMEVYIGSELEFYLYRESPETAREKGYQDLQPITQLPADYSLLLASRDEWFLQMLRNQLTEADIPVEGSKTEFGPGQVEVNLLYADALQMADRHSVFKHAVKEIAQSHGFLATFMAKPFTTNPGSGGHIHLSVKHPESGENLFWDSARQGASDLLLSFLAGIQSLAPELFLIYAPYVNSYKRFVPGNFAPTTTRYGSDDRTAAFRLAGKGESVRIENRLPGADANPYLCMAAMIASGLHGVERRMPLSSADPSTLPRNPVEAIQLLQRSEEVPRLLGEELVHNLLTFGQSEVDNYFRQVTDWERQGYLELA